MAEIINTPSIGTIAKKMQPPKIFLGVFNLFNYSERQSIIQILYKSLKQCLNNDTDRIIEGGEGRYAQIIARNILIDIPITLDFEKIPQKTDEQILFGISTDKREFDQLAFMNKIHRDKKSYTVIELYINSSRMDKIAILQFLQDLDFSETPTRPAQEHVALLLSGQQPYSNS